MRTPGSQSALKCIPKVFCRVGVRAMCRPHGFFHIQYYGAGSVHSHARTVKGLPQTVTTRVVAHKWSKMSLYAVALTIPVTRSTWSLKFEGEFISFWPYSVGDGQVSIFGNMVDPPKQANNLLIYAVGEFLNMANVFLWSQMLWFSYVCWSEKHLAKCLINLQWPPNCECGLHMASCCALY